MISRLFKLWDERRDLLKDWDKIDANDRMRYENIQLELSFLEGKYERLIRFLHHLRRKSCEMTDCEACMARELLIDLGEEVPLGKA